MADAARHQRNQPALFLEILFGHRGHAANALVVERLANRIALIVMADVREGKQLRFKVREPRSDTQHGLAYDRRPAQQRLYS
jgi:hypothetical protein